MWTALLLSAFVLAATPTLGGEATVDSTSIADKVITGYQAWFSAFGDGSPVNQWRHWSAGVAPHPGYQTFELWPDVREYAPEDLFQTGYANLGNGEKARLFSSFRPGVIDVHFRWMKEYGIDGAALQRFGVEIADRTYLAHRNSITQKVREAAEKHGRIFYIMYDISGMNESNFVEVIKRDWQEEIVGKLKVTESPQYAREGGKPVVNIWGLGFTDRPGTAEQAKELIQWFKEQGVYLIGGVPTNWRTSSGDSKPGWQDVYALFDMISPWTVGRYATDVEIELFYRRYLEPDLKYTRELGIAYQPVIFPGFAWSNWNGGRPNQIPRRGGEFFWRQAYNVRRAGIPAMYMAMFDEYDEGTALAKAAEDASMIPTNQYFLTLDADGISMSSDFYLRLAGAATRMIKGEAPMEEKVPIPYRVED